MPNERDRFTPTDAIIHHYLSLRKASDPNSSTELDDFDAQLMEDTLRKVSKERLIGAINDLTFTLAHFNLTEEQLELLKTALNDSFGLKPDFDGD